MSGWQPIETAPKDGTEIVLVTFGWLGSEAMVTNASWFTVEDDYDPDGGFWEFTLGGFAGFDIRQLWQPLPTPPE